MEFKKKPLPEYFDKLTKEELYEFFERRSEVSREQTNKQKLIFHATTRLHDTYYKLWDEPWVIIDMQAKRIRGLEIQMQEMQVGYKRKFEKLKKQFTLEK